jgi:hypothetical protein
MQSKGKRCNYVSEMWNMNHALSRDEASSMKEESEQSITNSDGKRCHIYTI